MGSSCEPNRAMTSWCMLPSCPLQPTREERRKKNESLKIVPIRRWTLKARRNPVRVGSLHVMVRWEHGEELGEGEELGMEPMADASSSLGDFCYHEDMNE